MKVGVLTNLNSRKNRDGASRLLDFGSESKCIVRRTSRMEEIRPALEHFLDQGCYCWVADGGDGTLHWMLNAGREVLKNRGLWCDGGGFPLVMPSNGGTIDFVARTARVRGDVCSIVRSLVKQSPAPEDLETIDLDTVDVRGHFPGDPEDVWSFEKIGFAVAIGGVGQKFFSKYYERPGRNALSIIDISAKAGMGFFASLLPRPLEFYVPENIREMSSFILSGTAAEVVSDGRKFDYGNYQGLHVSSVEIDFGTMKLFEYAREPGQLHIVVGTLPKHEVSYKWTWYVMGKPIPGRQWHEFAGKTLDVRATGDQLLDPVIDGEMFYGLDRLSVRLGQSIRCPVVNGSKSA